MAANANGTASTPGKKGSLPPTTSSAVTATAAPPVNGSAGNGPAAFAADPNEIVVDLDLCREAFKLYDIDDSGTIQKDVSTH